MAELWTPVPHGPNDEFVASLLKAIANFAEERGIERAFVEVETLTTQLRRLLLGS